MNVMFYGGWELMGSAFADRLIREGHSVCWMTDENEAHAALWYKKLSGKVYRGVFTAEKLRHILSVNGIDTFVFMTGELREQYGLPEEIVPVNEALGRILNTVKDYPLSRFVYLSSLELDAPGPQTPRLAELMNGEKLVDSYAQTYALPALTLRLGLVYGDCPTADMGYTGRMAERMRRGEKIECLYAPEDGLEVSECQDMAMAAYQLLQNGQLGLFRMLGGKPMTMKAYLQWIASALGKTADVQYLNQRKTAPMSLLLGDKRLRSETGWFPFTLAEQKGAQLLAKTLSSEEAAEQKTAGKKKHFAWLRQILKKEAVRKLLEVLGLFILTLYLLRFQKDIQDFKYVDIRLMYVAIASAVYGVRYGLLAIFLACASYVSSLRMSQIDTAYLISNVDSWIPFLVYVVTGTFVGYLVSRSEDEQAVLTERLRILTERFDFLKGVHHQVLEVKDKLQLQILNSENSFGHAFEIVKELDSLTPNLLFLKTINVLERVSGSREAAVYRLTDDYGRFARLEACSSALRERVPNSLELAKYPDVMNALKKDGLFVNLGLKPDYPDYVAAVRHEGKVYGLLLLYGMDMEGFTEANQTLIRITAGMIETSLNKALSFEESHQADRYVEGTRLLKPKALAEMREILSVHMEETFFNYMVVRVSAEKPMQQSEMAVALGGLVRASDYIGVDENGTCYAILMNIRREQLDLVGLRFARQGLGIEVEEYHD